MYINISIRSLEARKQLTNFVFNTLKGTRPNGSTIPVEHHSQAAYYPQKKFLYSRYKDISHPSTIECTSEVFIATNGKGQYSVGDLVIDDTVNPVVTGQIVNVGNYLEVVKGSGGIIMYRLNGTYYPQDIYPRLKVVDSLPKGAATPIRPLPAVQTAAIAPVRLLKPFDKSNVLNVVGMFHQLVKYPEIVETRPFILAELAKERVRIHTAVAAIASFPSYWQYDIKMAHITASVRAIALLESPDSITPQQVLDFYTYSSMIGRSTDYSWLVPHLTHANVTSKKPVIIFHSKHRHIELANGYISYTEMGTTYTTPIMFDADNNRFYF